MSSHMSTVNRSGHSGHVRHSKHTGHPPPAVHSDLIQSIRLCGNTHVTNHHDRIRAIDHVHATFALLPTIRDIHLFDSTRRTALWWAVDVGSSEITSLLLQSGATPSDQDSSEWNTIHVACDKGYANILELLLCPSLHQSPATLPSSNLVHARTSGPRWTALHLAASNGHVECVRKLLSVGASVFDLTEDGYTPLLLCCTGGSDGHASCCQLLLAAGANADVSDPSDGETPLHKACRSGMVEVAECLLEYGASIKLDHAGVTPISHALARGFDWDVVVKPRTRR